MLGEREPYCLLGNGTCPVTCLLYDYAAEITAALGISFNPEESRLRIVFADAFDPDINVVQVAAVIAKCANEPKIPKQL